MAETNDGRLLAVPCGRDVLLFETATGALYRTLSGHTTPVFRPAFSADGHRVAAGSQGSVVLVWDVPSGRLELTLEEHEGAIWSTVFDRTGKRLVTANDKGMIKVWDEEGEVLESLTSHTKGVNELAISPDGKRLASASLEGTCRIWDAETWKEIHELAVKGAVFDSVAWSPTGDVLAAGHDTGAYLWNTRTFELLHILKTPATGLLAYAPDGRSLLAGRCNCLGGEHHAFSRWDVASGTLQATVELPTSGEYSLFHLSRDGKTVYLALHFSPLGRVGVYDALTGKAAFAHEGHRAAVLSVAFSPDGRTLASGSADRTVRLWDLGRWRQGELFPPVRILEGHGDEVWSVVFTPDGKVLASGGTDGRIVVWDAASGRKLRELLAHSSAPSHLSFGANGRIIAAGGKDGTVNRWDSSDGQPMEPWHWQVGEVRSVAYSPDGRLLASGGRDGTVQLVDAITGQRLHTFRGSTFFTNVAFGPDSRTVAAVSAAPDAALHLWDVDTSADYTLTGHAGHIFGLAFHPGGKWVATCSLDGTMRLWDATPPGRPRALFPFHGVGDPMCAAFSPEGRYLAFGLSNGMIAIMPIPSSLPEYASPPAANLISSTDLARRPAAADALRRETIPPELLKKAGRGDKEKAPAELVAVFGEDRHAAGQAGTHVYVVAISPDGNTLAVGGTDEFVRLIDLATGQPRRRLAFTKHSPKADLYTLAFSPDGKILAGATEQGQIGLWHASTGDTLTAPKSQDARVTQLAFSPDSTMLASAGNNRLAGAMRLWNVATGEQIFRATFPSPRQDMCAVWCVAFSPDGKTFACGLESGDVSLYDAASGWRIAGLDGLPGRVRWIGFHPDGRSIAVAGRFDGNSVYLWDPANRQPPRRLSGHDSEVLSGAWRGRGAPGHRRLNRRYRQALGYVQPPRRDHARFRSSSRTCSGCTALRFHPRAATWPSQIPTEPSTCCDWPDRARS